MKNEKESVTMTNSQAKRAARKKEAERVKKQALKEKIIWYSIGVVVVLAIVALICAFVVRTLNRVVPSDDYSACLDMNGFINGTAAGDIELPEYNNVTIPFNEVEYTDEELENYIDSMLEARKTINDDTSLKVASGDEINLDYVGKIDGVEFEGGSAEGYDLVIGSESFIPGFEDQLIDAQVGSTFDIDVTFPEDYSENLAGKDAVFTITVNGIYETPELTDDFIVSEFGDVASTVEEYKQHIIDTNYDSNLTAWIENYIEENSNVIRFDKKYLKNLKSVLKYEEQQNYEYMNEMYESILGYSYYSSFEDYVGMSETEYDETVVSYAKDAYKVDLAYQAIFEIEGLSIDTEYAKTSFMSLGNTEAAWDNQSEQYGAPYMMKQGIKNKVIEYIKSKVNVQ